MKRNNYIALGAATLLLGLSSCSKDYLNTTPTEYVNEQDVITDITKAKSVINGVHRIMYNQWEAQDQAGQGSININMDVMGDDLVHTAQGNGWFNASYQWTMHRNQTAGTVKFLYRFYYRIIANVNNVVNNLDNIVASEEEKEFLRGQALTYRAWSHFMLVQLFGERFDAGSANDGLGVPIVLSQSVEPIGRSTVAEVYTQINADLDAAIAAFEKGEERSVKSELNKNVAHGVKARVALTMQDWATAAEHAALAREGYDLMGESQYTAGFNDISNPEWIWGSHQVVDQTTYFYSFFAYMSANFNSTNIRSNPKAINSWLYDQMNDTDYRKQLWSPTGEGIPIPPNGSAFPYINKKFLSISSSSSVGDVVYMRASEMYLIEAEAKARLGQADAADVLLALVSERDPAYTRPAATGQALVEEIWVQRRIELWGEGFRFLDLKRTNSKLDRRNTNHQQALCEVMEVEPGDNRWQVLFPQDEINANDKIVQNP